MNLNLCLSRAANLSESDEALLKRLTADYQSDGKMSQGAASQALEDVKRLAYADRNDVISDISIKGGVIPPGKPVLFSPAATQQKFDDFAAKAGFDKTAAGIGERNENTQRQARRPRSRDNASSLADGVKRDEATGIPVDEEGRVPLTHWGATKGLTELDPEFWGTAAAGQTTLLAGDPNFRNRVYFGLPGYIVDSNVNTVAHARYFATLEPEDLYHWDDDPAGIRARVKAENPDLPVSIRATMAEGAIVDAGYKGYWGAHTAGPIAVVFSPIEVEQAQRYHGTVKEPGTPLTVAGVDAEGNLPVVPKMSPRRTDEMGFYSELTAQVESLKQPKAPPAQWKAMVKKLPKVKKAEIEWSGVMEWLDDQKGSVNRNDLVEYLKSQEVQLKEVVKGESLTNEKLLEDNGYRVTPVSTDLRERFDTFGHLGNFYATDVDGVLRLEDQDTYETDTSEPGGYAVVDRYDSVQFTGDSAQEVLDQAPTKMSDWDYIDNGDVENKTKYHDYKLARGKSYKELLMVIPSPGYNAYVSPHWDEPNVLVHTRYDDRTVGGQNTLFVEEIQSDFLQDYRQNKDKLRSAIDLDFDTIVSNMKLAKVLEVNCD